MRYVVCRIGGTYFDMMVVCYLLSYCAMHGIHLSYDEDQILIIIDSEPTGGVDHYRIERRGIMSHRIVTMPFL